MPTGEEIDERVNEQIDREEVKKAILKYEIENLKKAVEQCESIQNRG